ncbi:transcriptional regulator [Phytohabitans aurantiacus]|uniref:Transcriptional regulator n=1 Tax=Phytohabitans aurantiacus TaxID=3016789 RepID=A0ABQ5R2T1_9ACTN|nr:transcriptional regulator [Phytohabitans aurantiacus]
MLFGRTDETHRIDELLTAARQGHSGVLVLRGEAGIGKTALLEYAIGAAPDMRICSIRGWEPERELAFAGLAQFVLPHRHRLDDLPPAQSRALRGAVALGPAESADRFSVYVATLGLLGLLAENAPVLLTVDDAHVLDAPSAEALAFSCRRLVAEGIVVLVASRLPESAAPSAGALLSLPLTRLDEDAAARLVAQRSGLRPHRDLVRQLVRGTGGNPMALLETLNHLSPAQLTGRQPAPGLVPAGTTAALLFERRVATLGAPARAALLLLAASSSARLSAALEAAEIMQIPRDAFDELEAERLVTFDGPLARFSHPLIATAALSAAGPGQRRAAHRVLAAVLISPDQADERAMHLAEATLGTNEKVADALEQVAGVSRARSGYAAAVSALERAAALSEDDSSRARRLYLAAADAQLAGLNARAREMLIAADGLARDVRMRVAVAAGRSRVEAFSGHPALAHRILREAATSLRDEEPVRRAELLTDSAMAALLAGDSRAAMAAAEEAERIPADPSASTRLVTRLVRGITLMHLGRHRDGVLMLSGCAALARRTGPDRPPIEYMLLGAAAMSWTGQHKIGRDMALPLVDELRGGGALGLLPFGLYALGSAEVRAGRIGAAQAAATEAVELAEATGDVLWRYLGLSLLTLVEAIRGDVDACREHGRTALELRQEHSDYPRDANEAVALLELSLGRYTEAIECLRQGVQHLHPDASPDLVDSNRDMIEAYLRSGRELTGAMRQVIADHLGPANLAIDVAVARRLRGLAAAATNIDECFESALKEHVAAAIPFETARTHLAYGERLRRAGRRVDARIQLRLALEMFERLGATVWSERTRQELTATGESIRTRPTALPLERLTAQEYQVARAVAHGATNREAASALFLSTKTIEFHLGNVYRKLSVRTRTELAVQHPELSAG